MSGFDGVHQVRIKNDHLLTLSPLFSFLFFFFSACLLNLYAKVGLQPICKRVAYNWIELYTQCILLFYSTSVCNLYMCIEQHQIVLFSLSGCHTWLRVWQRRIISINMLLSRKWLIKIVYDIRLLHHKHLLYWYIEIICYSAPIVFY